MGGGGQILLNFEVVCVMNSESDFSLWFDQVLFPYEIREKVQDVYTRFEETVTAFWWSVIVFP